MTNSVLTDCELDAVAGGDSAVHFKIFGFMIGITKTDTPNGPITCTTIRTPSGKTSSSCTIPV